MPKSFEVPVVVGALASHFKVAVREALSIFRGIFGLDEVRKISGVYRGMLVEGEEREGSDYSDA